MPLAPNLLFTSFVEQLLPGGGPGPGLDTCRQASSVWRKISANPGPSGPNPRLSRAKLVDQDGVDCHHCTQWTLELQKSHDINVFTFS